MTIVLSDVGSLFQMAEDYRVAVADAMGTTDAGPPDRSWVSLGAPAWETQCSQAVVQIVTLNEESTRDLSPGMQTGLRHFRGAVNLVGLIGYAIRCITVTDNNMQGYSPPTDAELSADAKAGYDDGWAVWNHVKRAINKGTLFPNGGPVLDAHFDLGMPVTPMGGLGGWQFSLRVELGGYVPMIDQ